MTATPQTARPDPSAGPVLPRSMTLHEWSELDVDRRVELVEGVPVVTPFEPFPHLGAAHLLGRAVEAARPDLLAMTNAPVDLTVGGGRPTVRIPDLVVFAGPLPQGVPALPAARVLLAVEVVSATSVERDWVTKRGEYARAGVARYLLVDGLAGCLALFDRMEDGAYLDGAPPSETISLDVDGTRIRVDLRDLFPERP